MGITRLDVDPESLRALEFDAVVSLVAAHAVSAAGAARLLALEPLAEVDAIDAEQEAVAEAVAHGATLGRLLPGRVPDPEPALGVLRIEGLTVEPLRLRDLASVLLTAADLRRALLALDADEYPSLRTLGASIPDLGGAARVVATSIGPDGALSDDASAELKRLRHEVARTGERLRRQLESFVHDPQAAATIRDEFVTQRNGRFVIPIRADAPRPVKGIVHAASSSGQTLFVEPLESVELNNDLVRLAEEEIAEQERIVRGWADRFRARLPEVEDAVAGVVRADTLEARSLWAREVGATRPSVREGVTLDLEEVRHPLLDRRLREAGGRCVPLRFVLADGERALVLSGPNTGGKTVALKSLGLSVLMAQAGIPVPAARAALPLFRQLRADIGDHQSIDADLSTFSAHVRAVARYVAEARPPALFLFDEIGTGTEPGEGAALAQAILERLVADGVTAVVTTHQSALKAWAFTTPAAASAAMEFDQETLRPTFRIVPGAAGVSAGIEVASRLGLDPGTVARARDLMGEGGRQAEASMARLRDLLADALRQRDLLAESERALAEERRRLERSVGREVDRVRGESRRALEEALAQFREASRREIASIQDKRERARLERQQAKAEMRMAAERRELERRVGAPARPSPPPGPFEPVAGSRVRIVSLSREGEVVAVKGDRVEVRMGSATFAVRRADLESAQPVANVVPGPAARPADRPREEPPSELLLLGKTVDEALDALDRFLDGAVLAGRSEVRIVHGHGTGRLKTAVRRFLRSHSQVEDQRPGGPGEGGDGATVARLRV